MKRFSQMGALELETEMNRLWEAKENAKTNGMPNEADMLERKYYMAKAYTLSPESFPPGLYKIVDSMNEFTLNYINGVMAWGVLNGEEEEVSYPLSMLVK